MKKRLAALADRRRRLSEKIESQRMKVAEISLHWQNSLVLVDAGLKAVCFVRNHPTFMTGGVAALLALRRKGMVGLAQEGWRLLYLYPAVLTFGLKYLSTAFRSPGAEHKTGVCH